MIDRPVFVVGMPRSGTTALRDVLEGMPGFATTTNVTRKCPGCFPVLRLIAPLYRRHRPVEAGSMWDRFVTGDSDVLRTSEATPRAKAFYTRAVENVLKLYKQPRFLSKCPRNGLRMEFLLAIFPDARFIHLIRDGRAVCRSILQERQKAGRLDAWWDVKPEGWRQWESMDPVDAIAHQWDNVVRAVSENGARLPPEQYIEVKYEDYAADPVAFVQRLTRFCEIEWPADAIREATRHIENRNDKWAKEFSPDQIGRITKIAGDTLKRFGYL